MICEWDNETIDIASQECPKITIGVNNIEVQALFDSGSQISVMSESVYKRMTQQNHEVQTLPMKKTLITLANNKKTQLETKQVWARVKVGKREIQHVMLILKELIHDVILGSDFMHKTGCSINYKEGNITCEGEVITFISKERLIKEVCYIHSETAEKEGWEKALKELLERYRKNFSDRPGVIKGYEHRIKIIDGTPYQARSYPVPHQYRTEVEKQLSQMEEWGIISKGSSPYNNPLVIVKKKDGSVRLCLDARQLNRITWPDQNIPPPMNELLSRFCEKEIFSTLDLTASYWQIKLHPADRKYTAFRYNGISYQFNRMPFGLRNSGAGLLKCLDRVLSPEIKKFVTIYMDDVIIASKNPREHLKHLQMFLQECEYKGIRINLKKSCIAAAEVNFLGHVISKTGIKPHPDKIQAIREFPAPKSVRQVRSFLGLCNFYNKFYRNFAMDMEPLLRLLRKNVAWEWTNDHDIAFAKVKEKFLSQVMLIYPDFKKKFIVQVDSSGHGLGAALMQEKGDGDHGVIFFISRPLRGPEVNYSVTEKEALAVVWAFQRFRQFLIGSEVVVRTDHKSLEFLNHSYLSNSRLIRWSLFLQEFNYTIEYCKGSENVVADALSRNPGLGLTGHLRTEDISLAVINTEIDASVEDELNRLGDLQKQDPKYQPIIGSLEKDEAGENGRYRLTKGVLWYLMNEKKETWRMVVPEALQDRLIMYTHCLYGHYGIFKIEKLLKTWFYWPKMRQQIIEVLNGCEMCQKTKPANKSYAGRLNPILPEKPNDLVAIDFYGPLPKFQKMKYILVVYDVFTKWVSAYPMAQANTKTAIRLLETQHFPKVGRPKAILSDHGTPFTASEWREWTEEMGLRHILSSIRNPQSNPCERVMRELGRLFRVYTSSNHKGWMKQLPRIVNYINWTENSSTRFAPIRLQFCQPVPRLYRAKLPNVPEYIDRETDRRKATMNMKQAAGVRTDRGGARTNNFKRGDKVWVKVNPVSQTEKGICKKFQNLYDGPYRIIRENGPNAFTLANEKGEKGTFNARALKPYKRIYPYSNR